ncbi:MAG: enoyl-CoA hydratase/isomerase family protein [Allosphingosinicella sp.]
MLHLRLDGPIARLLLDRPEARNAIPVEAWPDIARLAKEAARDGARVLILSGSAQAFSAGADLAGFPALQADEPARVRFRRAMREGIDGLAASPLPSLALIEGPCFGAGVALALACDVRIAAPAATFAITPAKFGISYPQEDIARLVALVGPGQASRLLLGAQSIDACEAARIGLVEIVADDASAAALALAEAIVAASPASHAALKRGIALAARGTARDADHDAAFDALFGSPDFAARFAALRGGR